MAAKKSSKTTSKTELKKKVSVKKSGALKSSVDTLKSKSKKRGGYTKVNGLFKKTKYLYLGIFLVLLVAATVYFGKSYFIAATVNGQPITRFEIIKNLEKQGGQQALDNLVTKKLILQEAENKSITVSDDEINKEIDNIRGMVTQQGSTLEDALALQNQTMDDLKENIKLQKTVEKIFSDDIKVSDDDISKYFDDNKDMYPDQKLEDVKDQIKQTLSQQQLSTKFNTWLTDAKQKASINYYINYGNQ